MDIILEVLSYIYGTSGIEAIWAYPPTKWFTIVMGGYLVVLVAPGLLFEGFCLLREHGVRDGARKIWDGIVLFHRLS